jgi:hypothetical protein
MTDEETNGYLEQLDRALKRRGSLVLLAVLLLGGVGSGGLYSVVSTQDRYTATQAKSDQAAIRWDIAVIRARIDRLEDRVRRNERDIDRLK